MKKKIHGLSELTTQFVLENNISFTEVLKLFYPFVTVKFMNTFTKRYHDFEHVRPDGTKYKNDYICIVDIKVKKAQRKKIKRILPRSQIDNQLTFFYHIQFDKNGNETSRELRFRNGQMFRIRDFKFYDFLYEFRKLLPNLIIDLEIMLYRSL